MTDTPWRAYAPAVLLVAAAAAVAHCGASNSNQSAQPYAPVLYDDAGYCVATANRGSCLPQMQDPSTSGCAVETTWYCINGAWCACGGEPCCHCVPAVGQCAPGASGGSDASGQLVLMFGDGAGADVSADAPGDMMTDSLGE